MKKVYQSPKLIKLGNITEITQGQGRSGNADSWWFISWGAGVSG